MWELREKFTDRAGFIWLECLSIADRNLGVVGPDSDQLRKQLASKCRTSRAKVESALRWCGAKGWLAFGERVEVVKWAKYNKTRETKKHPSEPSEPNLPNQPPLKSPKGGDVVDMAFRRFWECYPKKVNKAAAIRAWKKEAAIVREVQEKIMAALVLHKQQYGWRKDNGQYIPNPATWLNGRRWEDELFSERGTYERSVEPKGFKAIREILKEQNES
jgi:hypothetical protein